MRLIGAVTFSKCTHEPKRKIEGAPQAFVGCRVHECRIVAIAGRRLRRILHAARDSAETVPVPLFNNHPRASAAERNADSIPDRGCDRQRAVMALGDYYVENIRTSRGELKVAPLAVEPVCDIAVLGSLDEQAFFEEAGQCERFCEDTEPVPLCFKEFRPFQKFPVFVYTHKHKWVCGRAMQCVRNSPVITVDFDEQIEGGTSGSPIVNELGELVGIISHCSEGGNNCDGRVPRPHLTLPVWAVKRISSDP